MGLVSAAFLALWCFTFLVVGLAAGAASALAVVVAAAAGAAVAAGAATAAGLAAGAAAVAGVACAKEARATPDNKLAAIRDLIFNMVYSLIKRLSHKLRLS